MTVEVLFPKLCNLYGDIKNMDYLRLCMPEADFVETQITDQVPYFGNHHVDMIYMGFMSEKVQPRVVEWLMPQKNRLNELIEDGTLILFTGNAFEILTDSIENLTTKQITPGLGLIHLTTKIDLFDRYNDRNLGTVDGIRLLGFRSQFSMVYGDNSQDYFMSCEQGHGINRDTSLEGVRRNNLICTHMTGPLLVLNPLFTEHLMGIMGVHEPQAAFRDVAMAAYERRLANFLDPKAHVVG